MNRLISAYFWICIFLFAPFSENLSARDTSLWTDLMNNNEYRAASVVAERIYFEAETNLKRAQAVLARSWALKHLGEKRQARENLRRVSLRNVPPELEYRIHHERTLLQYLEGEFSDALNSLEQLRHFVDNQDWLMLSGYLEILLLAELERWDEAQKATENYLDDLNASFPTDSVFTDDPPQLKNPDRAEILSSFLPGAGLIYAGNTPGGLGSAAMQLTALGWGAYNVVTGYYLTALFSGGGLFQAFYFGGIERAGSIARSYNQQMKADYNARITNNLLEQVEPYLNKKRRTLSDSPFEIE